MPLEQRHFEDLTRDQQLFQLAKAFNPSFAMEQRHFESLTRDQQLFQLYTVASAGGGGGTTIDSVDENQLFGGGSDGSLAAGFGTLVPIQDTYYDTIVVGATDSIQTGSWRMHIKKLDLTLAGVSAVRYCALGALDGLAGIGTVGGLQPTFNPVLGTLGAPSRGVAGKNQVSGVGNAGGAGGTVSVSAGGPGGPGGAGGTAAAGATAGGAGGAGGVTTTRLVIKNIETNFLRGGTPIGGGAAGGSGASGGGTATPGSGVSGSSGTGGGFSAFFIEELITGPGTPAMCFDFRGGNGGAALPATGSNNGGAGGCGGGGGGAIYMVIGKHTGALVANFFNSSGGNGSAGSAFTGTGAIGIGGAGGNGGSIVLINLALGTTAVIDNGVTAAAIPAVQAASNGVVTTLNLP